MRLRASFRLLAAVAVALLLCTGSTQAQQSRPYEGRVAFITGSTSGMGAVLAYQLSELGAEVLVHGRNEERGNAVVDSIHALGGKARFYRADLGSVEETLNLATAVQRDYDRLDLFISNAAVGPAPNDRLLSADGHELRFHVNYLAGYQLTHLLLPLLQKTAPQDAPTPTRIVMVASRMQRPVDFDDVMFERRQFRGSWGYAQSKLAQIMFTFDFADELDGTGVFITAVHPAPVMDTQMMEIAGARPQTTPEDGARSVMNVVLSEEGLNGRYFHQLEPGTAHDQANDAESRARLRALSAELTGAGGR